MGDNRTIAKNTVIVYFQLFITIILNLVISRLVLQALGASDFGLYNVVGGVVGMFTFISASMSATTTRFLNYEMGKPEGNLNKVFNQSNVLHISIALLILFLLETIGTYYIYNHLNVSTGKELDAMFVFQVSTIVACIGIINVPYQAIFVAHEKFNIIALVDISNVIIKLFIVIGLLYYNGNVLKLYAVGMSLTTFFSFIVYHLMSKKKWPEIIMWKPVHDWKSYKEQLFYSNWNLLSTASLVGRSQGSAILINFFFGTTVNAAYAIADMVLQQVNGFVGRFDTAVAPQITQNIGSGNMARSVYLASNTCRICILVMIVLFFTLYVELESVLYFWLGNVPEGALVFCKYTLLIALVSSTAGGIAQLINGSGQIKWFKIQLAIWNICPLLICFFLYSSGMQAQYIVLLFVVADILNRITQLYLLKKLLEFDVKKYINDAYFRPFVAFLVLLGYLWVYRNTFVEYHLNAFVGILLTLLVSVTVCFYIGFQKNERNRIISMGKNGTNKLCRRF